MNNKTEEALRTCHIIGFSNISLEIYTHFNANYCPTHTCCLYPSSISGCSSSLIYLVAYFKPGMTLERTIAATMTDCPNNETIRVRDDVHGWNNLNAP